MYAYVCVYIYIYIYMCKPPPGLEGGLDVVVAWRRGHICAMRTKKHKQK